MQPELLQVVLASVRDGVIITDGEGRLSRMNAAAEFLTGWSEAEAVGQSLADVLGCFDEHQFSHAIRTGTPVEYSFRPVSTGGAVLVFRDSSTRAAADELPARLAAIVESSDDAIISKTLDGIIQSWNRGATRIFGYTSDEAIGRPITLIIPPERHDEEREILARIAGGERVDHFETVRVTKTGSPVEIALTVSPVRDPSGRIIGASKVARDISSQKRVEGALREADLRKDRFIALLAHELRNPLAPLRNGLQVMRLAADDDRAVAEARAMMERQLAHMVRLIDDLLDVARINQSKMELRRSRILLADVVSLAVETARPAIDEAGHGFTVSLPTEPVYLDADLTRLGQVFSNLLMNSAKYTPRGGRLRLTAERDADSVRVSVHDTGIGIPGDAMPRIFDMYSQVDRTIERSSGGLGIGLALVKGLVEMHGGTVQVSSDGPGRGSHFAVTLPVRGAHVAAAPSEPVEEILTTAPWRILVADDNRDSANSMAMLLRIMGHQVDTANDGEEAVQQAEALRPEVILMDLGMPRLSGYDATQRIREQSWGRKMIIIALTGWGHDSDRVNSRDAGCDGHLVKPVNVRELQKILAAYDEGRSGSQSIPPDPPSPPPRTP
jgi:PAS domain S-box-containing protein